VPGSPTPLRAGSASARRHTPDFFGGSIANVLPREHWWWMVARRAARTAKMRQFSIS
jgi:hypothetical protein